MKKEYYSDAGARDAMWKQLEELMGVARNTIWKNDDDSRKYYDANTHAFLYENTYELMFPLDKEKWPSKFQEHYLEIQAMVWPQFTTYCYGMDVIAPPCVPLGLLHFGYAVVDGILIKTTFFVVQMMVDYQLWAQGMVIDPLAVYHGKMPQYYIGCPIPDTKFILEWRRNGKHPLEGYVSQKNEKERSDRIYDSSMQAYYTQMTYEPHWFPDDLITFAKQEGLYVPPQGYWPYKKV